jgi:hypothetical protein
VERVFQGVRVTFKPSGQKGILATLWIEAPEEQRVSLEYRAAILCRQIYEDTRAVVVPIVVTPQEAAEAA